MSDAPTFHFADAFVLRARELGHPLCFGLDPHLDKLPPLFRRGGMEVGSPETADAVQAFLLAVVERIAGRVAVVKPQIAFFEQLGWRGLQVLEAVVSRARELGLLVLLDAKRGDVGSTAEAYARAYLDPESPLSVDAITLSPYLGLDTLEPFIERARRGGKGLFVLVRTSNRGAGDLQDLAVDGTPVHRLVARELAIDAESLRGETGWSNLGAVVGATWPEQAEEIRADLPHSLFLVPGYGSQGGSAAEAVRGFVGSEGGLVNSARGVLFPDGSHTDDAGAWEKAIDTAVDRAAAELAEELA